jgi:uncharacterized protein
MHGEVVYFELPVRRFERARAFYAGVFGWAMALSAETEYTVVGTTATGPSGHPLRAGAINGGLLRRQPPVRSPVITIEVDDIDRAVAVIEQRGGRIVQPRSPIGDGKGGHAAYFTDPEGNTVGLFEPARRRRPPRARSSRRSRAR